MVNTKIDKIKVVFSMYSIILLLPNMMKMVSLIIKPLDSTRFLEFSYILKFLSTQDNKKKYVLDVASPHLLAYFLCKNNLVTKTNIDPAEKRFIKENKNLNFEIANALKLNFPDNNFDFVYSISVIEHIYSGYMKAIQEMIRVTKPGGHIYITFPVSKKFQEEWGVGKIYSNQAENERGTFFQYRFSEKECEEIEREILKESKIISKDIFWEKKDGNYNRMIQKIHTSRKIRFVGFLYAAAINWFYGFSLLNEKSDTNFTSSKNFGNMHLIIQK